MSTEELTDFADGREIAERTVLMQHLSKCPACSDKLGKLTEIIGLMRSDRSEDAPRDVMAAAVNIFGRRSGEAQPSLLRRLVATLRFDSLSPAAAFGVRSGQSGSRQLIYSAEESDIDLRLSLQDDKWTIAGQVLTPHCTGGRVEIEGAQGPATAQLNDLCEFRLGALPSGKYSLRVKLAEMEVEIPQFELQS